MAASGTSRFAIIQSPHLTAAIDEYKSLGREKILARYGFSRSSKYYLFADGRIFDTKVLVAAAYFAATGHRLTRSDFAGGAQTKSVIERLLRAQAPKRDWFWFEDKHRELANINGEFDRLPGVGLPIGKIGFSDWIPFSEYPNLGMTVLPGVYVLASLKDARLKISVTDERIVYVGETTTQTLRERLTQFRTSASTGKRAHSGGRKLCAIGTSLDSLHLAIRPFSLDCRLPDDFVQSVRSAQIKFLERMILNEYALAHGKFPIGNSR